jgi:serine/threonine protein kinase
MTSSGDPFETLATGGFLKSPVETPSTDLPTANAGQAKTSKGRRTPAVTPYTGEPTVGPGSRKSNPRSQNHQPQVAFSEIHGRYDRVGELGRGGCGVVDRVIDRQLEREVAIKRIGGDARSSSGKIDPTIRERFLHEARITSQLQHPGVVPVHELSTGENGEAFYVMKLLEGDTFRHLIRKQHAPAKEAGHRWTPQSLQDAIAPLLDRFIDICNAVAYAHQQGVIHRDLKPANVMVGSFGETIVVDWGLAKRIESADEDAPAPVRTAEQIEQEADDACRRMDLLANGSADPVHYTTQGTVVGTPAYMSPEQAAGNISGLSPRSDIYSLGVILYEIVAGRHPYRDLDIFELLEQVKAGKWPPLRTAQASAPRALARICEVAMAYDPAARYSTACQLAEDVRRFIAGEAVSVYKEPPLDRIARFCRRHQSGCITASASLVILAAVSMGFGVVVHSAHQSEKAARIEAQSSHEAAVRSLVEARDTADRWLVDLSGSLEFYPGMESVRDELQAAAIAQYQRLIDEEQDDAIDPSDGTIRLESAKCHLRLGDLYRLAEQYPSAEQHYGEAESILIGTDFAEDLQDAARLQVIQVAIGRLLLGERQVYLYRSWIRKNSGTSEFLRIQLLPVVDFLLSLALPAALSQASVDWVGHREWLLGRLQGIDPSQASQNDASAPTDGNERHEFQIQVASALVRYHLAMYRRNSVEHSELASVTSLPEAVTWAEWLVAVRGQSRDQSLLQTALRELATGYERAGLEREASDTWRRSIQHLQDVIAKESPRPDHLQSLAHARMRYAHCAATLNEYQDAEVAYRSAIDELALAWQLLDADTFHQVNLAIAQHNLGHLLAAHEPDRKEEAEGLLEGSIRQYESLLRREVAPDTLRKLSQANQSLADLLAVSKTTKAISHFERANVGYEMLADHKLLTNSDTFSWIEVCIGHAKILFATGDNKAGTKLLESAQSLVQGVSPVNDRESTRMTKLADTIRELTN